MQTQIEMQPKLHVVTNNSQIIDEPETPRKIARWKKWGVALGLMRNDEKEPRYNTVTILLAIALLGIIGWQGGAFISDRISTKIDEKDQQRFKESQLINSARRFEESKTREQEKRAELLQLLKEKGLYDEIPERLKTYETSEADGALTKEEKK